jgi:hypothetical protein
MRSVGAASPGGVLADVRVRNDLAPGSMWSGLITTAASLPLWPPPGAESVSQYFSIGVSAESRSGHLVRRVA